MWLACPSRVCWCMSQPRPLLAECLFAMCFLARKQPKFPAATVTSAQHRWVPPSSPLLMLSRPCPPTWENGTCAGVDSQVLQKDSGKESFFSTTTKRSLTAVRYTQGPRPEDGPSVVWYARVQKQRGGTSKHGSAMSRSRNHAVLVGKAWDVGFFDLHGLLLVVSPLPVQTCAFKAITSTPTPSTNGGYPT